MQGIPQHLVVTGVVVLNALVTSTSEAIRLLGGVEETIDGLPLTILEERLVGSLDWLGKLELP